VDFLAELGLAPLPTSPTAEGGSTPRKAPAGVEADDFAAHMRKTPRALLLEQAQAERSSSKSLIVNEQRVALDQGEVATSEHQTVAFAAEQIASSTARRWHPDGAPAFLDAGDSAVFVPPAPDGRSIEPTPAAPHRREGHWPDGAAARAPAAQVTAAITEPAAAIGPESAAFPEQATKGPAEAESGKAHAAQETEPGSDQLAVQSSTDRFLVRPPADAPMADAKQEEPVHAFPPERQVTATSASTDDEKGAPPAARLSRADLAPATLQPLHQTSGPEVSSGASHGVSPPAVLDAGLTGSSEPARPRGAEEVVGTIEQQSALGSRHGADGGRELPVQVKFAAQVAEGSAQPREAAESAVKQPESDSQIGRLANLPGSQGTTISMPHAAIGPTGELAQSFARALDGAVTLEHGPASATKQVALQMTRALDQDRTEIRIRLDPPELGDVDIHLEFRDLRLTATFSAERSDTLDLLQRDARTFARALREAGIELADSDLSFAYNERNDRPDPGHVQRTIALPHALGDLSPVQDQSLALGKPDGFVSLSDGRMDLRV
jgi:flagellar hook-length control protein FliK